MVTIEHIARELGITPSTVSRALAGSPRVKEETRRLVKDTAARMGYERNIVAANLRKGRSDIVGIVVPRINREFFSNIIGGAQSVLDQAGYNVIICQTQETLELEIKALKALRNNRVAGILISHAIGAVNSLHIESIAGNIPVVQFDRVFSDIPGAKIVGADFQGAYKATCHLIEQGYQRIGTVAGYMNSLPFRERLNGYKQALEDHGIHFSPELVFYDAIVREKGAQAGIKALEEGCDALYCAGAFSALGAMEAVRDKGISIPGEFGIVGTSDETFTSLTYPSMSVVGQRPYEMGVAAANAFLKGSSATETIPMELHVRESSARIKSNQII